MKTITLNNKDLVFVPIPDKASKLKIVENKLGSRYSLRYSVKTGVSTRKVSYASVSFYRKCEIIATTDVITEEQAAMFVRAEDDGYIPYLESEVAYSHASSAFVHFLQHYSITGRHAILKMI